MSMGPLLASFCKGQALCERMLNLWKAKDKWLGKDPNFKPKVVKEHFDEAKFQEYQTFWEA